MPSTSKSEENTCKRKNWTYWSKVLFKFGFCAYYMGDGMTTIWFNHIWGFLANESLMPSKLKFYEQIEPFGVDIITVKMSTDTKIQLDELSCDHRVKQMFIGISLKMFWVHLCSGIAQN